MSRNLSDSSDEGADDPPPTASSAARRSTNHSHAPSLGMPRALSSDLEDDAGNGAARGRDRSPEQVGLWPSQWPSSAPKRSLSPETESAGRGGGQKRGSPVKKKKATYSAAAEKMMAGMGFKAGSGLGKSGQGIVAPIEASMQRGRRGLGLTMPGLEPAHDLEWDPSTEVVEVEESFSWMAPYEDEVPSLDTLETWMAEGPRSLDISGETEFCEPAVLTDVLSSKSVFDALQPEEMRRARSRSNPFESIKGVFFLNRAAMKMANMDARMDFMFTSPTLPDGSQQVGEEEVLYFADVCAGPGGFSEYVLWRRHSQQRTAKGFGFTLKGECDFKLHDFHAGPVETFETHYGVGGQSGDGDVFSTENQEAFRDFVLKHTDGRGVHFMMADGGFSVDGQENIQEILSKQLYLCQCLTALNVVRAEGHFVCKLFDVFTPFSVGLVYLMRVAFREVCLFKPNTSRPANSERYIVCRWRRPDCEPVRDYLDVVNQRLVELGSSSSQDVMQLVPLHLLRADAPFYQYIRDNNDELARRQVVGLTKISTFYRDNNLREDRQRELRKQCLQYWQVPDKPRVARPPSVQPAAAIRGYQVEAEMEALASGPGRLRPDTLRQLVRSQHDWRAVVLGVDPDGDRNVSLVLGLGRQNTWRRGLVDSGWSKIDRLELPSGTLLLAELVPELRGRLEHPGAQRRGAALHLLDAIALAGRDVRSLPLARRHTACAAFAAAVNKPSRTDMTPVRCKRMYRMDEVDDLLDNLLQLPVKGSHHTPRLVHVVEDEGEDKSFFVPTGLLLLKCSKDPWMISFSRTQQREYWFDCRHNVSRLECPPESVAEFRHTARSRLLWPWRADGGCVTSPAPEGWLHRDGFTAHMALPPR